MSAPAVMLRVCGALGGLLAGGGGVVQDALVGAVGGLLGGGTGVGVMGAVLVVDGALVAAQEHGALGGEVGRAYGMYRAGVWDV